MFIMKIKNLQQRLKNTAIVLTLAFGFMILSASSASAQYYPQDNQNRDRQEDRRDRRDDRRDRERERQDDINRNNNGGYNNNNYSSAAQREGYRDGLAAGRDDRRDREQYNPQKHSDYKKGTDGYTGRGSKGQYKQAYRQAFLQGYAQAYNRNNNNRRRGY
jgi:hypothetical protein